MIRQFVIDEEISLVKGNDILKTRVYSESLVKVIKNTPKNKVFTIGLFGNWGTGKSSIIRTTKDLIEETDKRIKFITYDAWKYANDSFRRMFLLKIQQELKQGQTEVMQRFYQSESVEAEPKTYISTNGLGILCVILLLILIIINFLPLDSELKIPFSSAITLIGLIITIFNGIFQKLKVQINKPIIFAPEQFEECFKDMVSKSLKPRGIIDETYIKAKDYVTLGESSVTNLEKLVIVIDNIDRCHNDMAYQLLTDIKTFLSNEELNVVFIIPVDDEALKRNLFSNINCNKEKEEFLRKFFNVTLRIKPHQITELNAYTRKINEQFKLNFNADTVALCSKEFAANPRRIIQLFNNLSSELNQYSLEFANKNESAICAILIIREEYPDYYKSIINDPCKFKNYKLEENIEENKNLSSFMRYVGSIARNIELKDLLKILTNSDAIFDAIPEEIKNSVESYDAENTIKHLISKPKIKDDIFSFIKRSVEDNIRAGSEVQIINSIEYISALSVSIEFKNVYLKEIDILFSPYYDTLVDKINDKHLEHLCHFALILHNNSFESLKTEIVQHIQLIEERHENINEYLIKATLNVFKKEEDSRQLSNLVTNIFNTVDICTDVKYSTSQLNLLFTEELIQNQIDLIKIGDNKETEKLLWIFKNKKNITEESYLMLFKKVQQLIGTSNINNSTILSCIIYISKYLECIEDFKISNIEELTRLNKKLELRSNGHLIYYTLDEYKTDVENLHHIIDYIVHVYRISNGVITKEQIKKMYQYDKNYLHEKLINLQESGFDLLPFYNEILSDNDYSLKELILLTEHCLKQKNDSGNYVIDKTKQISKINSLLDNISNNDIQTLIEQLIKEQSLKELIIEEIVKRETIYINELPQSLLNLAVDCFSKETASSYNENFNFLAVIASKGSTEQKKELVKILTENINNRKYINQTFNILNNLELKKEYNKKMLSGALQAYKEDNTNDESRVDELIEKFSK